MNKIILILLLNILFISCKYKEQKTSTNGISSIDKKDTIFIENNQVLFISPSSKDFDEMKKRMGEENFYTIADDANFYGANAYEFLDSLNVNYINTDSDAIIAYKKNNKIEILSPIKSKWYSLLNKNEQLINIDLVTFEKDYKKIIDTNLKTGNKEDISTLLQKNILTPEKVVDNLIFTKDKNDSLQINTEILDYISKNTSRENSKYLIALENYIVKYKYTYREIWGSDNFSKIKAYIFNTSYPLRKKYWADKYEEWYNGKSENYLGEVDFWREKKYFGLPKLEEYVNDFIVTNHWTQY